VRLPDHHGGRASPRPERAVNGRVARAAADLLGDGADAPARGRAPRPVHVV